MNYRPGSVIIADIRLNQRTGCHMETDESHRIMAAAVYEIRLLLANYLGDDCKADPDVRLAAHLSYALHNAASSIMNDRPYADIEEMKSRIKNAQEIAGQIYSNGGGHLGVGPS